MTEPTTATRDAADWLQQHIGAGVIVSVGTEDALLGAALSELGRALDHRRAENGDAWPQEPALILCVVPRTGLDERELVARLCAPGAPVAFAGIVPGAGRPARWPAWWDDLFRQHGFVPVAADRPPLWHDEASSPSARQALTLYRHAPDDAGAVPIAGRIPVVHPATLLAALEASPDTRAASGPGEEQTVDRAVENDRTTTAAQSRPTGTRPSRATRRLFSRPRRTATSVEAAALASSWIDGDGSPDRWFDVAWYREAFSDSMSPTEDPLHHYLSQWRTGRFSPHPLFDTRWYLARYPDVAASDREPLQQFLVTGWQEDRDPHPLFDLSWYRSRPGSMISDENPWIDYLDGGWRSGHDPHPLFDVRWYLDTNPDVSESGLEPVTHYLRHGASEGRDPSRVFQTSWYCDRYPEVASSGTNPLVYFVTEGADRGHRPGVWSLAVTTSTS